jgi:Na+-driven multidrug efflux pump
MFYDILKVGAVGSISTLQTSLTIFLTMALIGTNIGAGQRKRALRIALTGGAMALVLTEIIGIAAAIWPHAWLGLFGHDPRMMEIGAAYLRIVGPAFGVFGLGLSLYFASKAPAGCYGRC